MPSNRKAAAWAFSTDPSLLAAEEVSSQAEIRDSLASAVYLLSGIASRTIAAEP